MTRLLDLTPLIETRFGLAAVGGVSAQARPVGASHYLVQGRMGAAAPFDPLDDNVQWAADNVAIGEDGPRTDGNRGAGLYTPVPLIVTANVVDTLDFINNDPVRAANVWLQWFAEFDPVGTSFMQLGNQPARYAVLDTIAFGPIAPAGALNFDAPGATTLGATHLVVGVQDVAGLDYRLEYYTAALALLHQEEFNNAIFPLSVQANYLRAQVKPGRLTIRNLGAVNVSGAIYVLMQY